MLTYVDFPFSFLHCVRVDFAQSSSLELANQSRGLIDLTELANQIGCWEIQRSISFRVFFERVEQSQNGTQAKRGLERNCHSWGIYVSHYGLRLSHLVAVRTIFPRVAEFQRRRIEIILYLVTLRR